MRDKKDNATFDLPGFDPVALVDTVADLPEPKRNSPRSRRAGFKQEQMVLLDETDTSGLPVWNRDPNLDTSGLPVWKPE